MLEDTLGAEHLPILNAVELDLLRWMSSAMHNLSLWRNASRRCVSRATRRVHRQSRKNLVVDGKLVGAHRV